MSDLMKLLASLIFLSGLVYVLYFLMFILPNTNPFL